MSDPQPLTPEPAPEPIPESVPAPPWELSGHGWVIMFRGEDLVRNQPGLVPAALRARYRAGFGAAVLVRYEDSPVGPYDELMLVPGQFAFGEAHHPSITTSYVSTRASALHGQRNWGIPKQLAEFEVTRPAKRAERFVVRWGGQQVIDVSLRRGWWRVPVSSSLVPEAFRTLAHAWDGRILLTDVAAKGWVCRAELEHIECEAELFPDVAPLELAGVVAVPTFHMTFPPARALPAGV